MRVELNFRRFQKQGGYIPMKDVKELNRDQLVELKQTMLCERMDQHGECPSYGELADVEDVGGMSGASGVMGGPLSSPGGFFLSTAPATPSRSIS